MEFGATWCPMGRLEQLGGVWCRLVSFGVPWCPLVQIGAVLVLFGADWWSLEQAGMKVQMTNVFL